MTRLRRALVYAATACAFLAASLSPCPSARVVRAHGADAVLSAPCPCHCGEHAAGSASPLDPALGSAAQPIPERVRPSLPDAPSFAASSAPLSLPDPVPIAG